MPKFTKKQFAELCGIKTSDLSNYIARGKVILDGELISSDDQTNQYFYEKRIEFNRKKAAISGSAEKTAAVDSSNNENNPPAVDENSPVPALDEEQKLNDRVAKKNLKEVTPELKFPVEHAPPTKRSQMDDELKEEILKKERTTNLILQSKLDKTLGESIPTELVKNLLAHHTKSIAMAFKNGAENLIVIFSTSHELSSAETAGLRKSLTDISNRAINEAVDESLKTLNLIVEDYSQKKEVGERE